MNHSLLIHSYFVLVKFQISTSQLCQSMSKLFLFIVLLKFLLFIPLIQTSAQNNLVDSLFVDLRKAEEDTNKVKILQGISDVLLDSEPVRSIKYSKLSLDLSDKISYQRGISYSLNSLGIAHYRIGKFELALDYFERLLTIAQKMNNPESIAEAYDNIAVIYIHHGSIEEALKLRMKANLVYASLNDKSRLASGYNWIGEIYKHKGDYSLALEYYLKCLRIYEETNDVENIGYPLLNISSIYRYLKQYGNAKYFALESQSKFLKINNPNGVGFSFYRLGLIFLEEMDYDSTIICLQKAKEIFEETKNNYSLTLVNTTLGNTYQNLGYFDRSLSYLNQGLVNALEVGDSSLVASCYQNIGLVYQKKGEYHKSLDYIYKSDKMLAMIDDKTSLMSISENFMVIYSHLSLHDSVIHYFERYKKFRDILFDEKLSNSVSEMQAKYETEKKDREIKILNAESLRKEMEQQESRERRILWTISVIVIIVVVFLLWQRKRKKAFDRKVSSMNIKVNRLQFNPHFIKNTLDFIDSFYIRNNDLTNASLYITKLQQLINLVLKNSELEYIPLRNEIEALELYANLMNLNTRNMVECTIEYSQELDLEQILVPPALIQPLIENAFKYAYRGVEYPHLKIVFSFKNEMLHCSVIDNGIGRLNTTRTLQPFHKRTGLGLKLIRERIELINRQLKGNGFFTIEDLVDNHQKPLGTKIELVVPVQFAF